MIKKVLLLVGMHRSGTSALAGLFYTNGFDLGRNLMKPAADNPNGFYENAKVVAFNNELLQMFGATWEMPFNVDFDAHSFDQYHYFKEKLLAIISDEFKDDEIVLKDPRISKLLPFYLRFWEELNCEVKIVLSMRNPNEIAQSLAKRNGMHKKHALWLWVSYMIDAEFYSRNKPRDFVQFDNLLSQAESEFNRICDGFFTKKRKVDTAIVNPELRHFSNSKSGHNTHDTFLEEYVYDYYNCLIDVSDEDNKTQREKIDDLTSLLLELSTTFFDQKIFPLFTVFNSTHYSKVCIDNGRGFNEWDERFVPMIWTNDQFTCEFDLSMYDRINSIRWYPILGKTSTLSNLQAFVVDQYGGRTEITANLFSNDENGPITHTFSLENPFVETEQKPIHEKFRLVVQGYQKSVLEPLESIAIKEKKMKKSFDETLNEHKKKNVFLFNKKNEIEQENQNKEEIISNLRKDLENRNNRIQFLLDQEKTKNDQLATIIEERDKLKNNLVSLKEQGKEELGRMETDLKEVHTSQIAEMLVFRNELMDELEQVKLAHHQKTEMLESRQAQIDEAVNAADELRANFDEQNNQYQELVNTSETQSATIEELNERIESSHSEMNEKVDRIEELENAILDLKTRLEKKKNELEKKSELVKKKNEFVNKLTSKVKELKKKQKKQKTASIKLKEALEYELHANEDLQASNEKQDVKLQKRKEQIITLKTELNLIANENDELVLQLEQRNANIEEVESINTSFQEELLNANKTVAKYLDEISNQKLSHTNEVEGLRNEQVIFNDKLIGTKNKNDQLAAELVNKEEQLLDLFSEKEARQEIEERFLSVTSELEELLELNEQREYLAEINVESEQDIFDRHFDLIVKLKEGESSKNDQVRTQAEQIAELTGQLSATKEQLINKEYTLHTQNQELSNQIESLKGDTDSRAAILNEQKSIVSSLQEELQRSKTTARNNKISIDAKLALIDDLKSDLLLKQEEVIRITRERVKYENHFKAVISHLEGVKNSLSYRLGFGVTSPLRFVYDKMTNKPFNKSGLGKNLVAELKESAQRPIVAAATEDVHLLEQNVWSGNKEINYNLGKVDPTLMPEHHPMVIDDSKLGSVLFISPHLPDYDESSGGKRATRMLEILSKQFNVFAFTLGDKPKKYVDKLRSLGVNVLETSRYDKAVQLMPDIHTIIYAWYYTYFDVSEFRTFYPNAKIICDTVDVHWVREFRSVGLMKGLTMEIAEENKKRERTAYENAAIIWTVTEEDKQEVLKEIRTADIRVVSNIHDEEESEYRRSQENNILFLGGYRHYPNISAAITLAEEIIPKVRNSVPDAKLILAGSHAPPEVEALGVLDGVDYRGFIEDSDIVDLYRNTLAIAAPLKAGAGIKGKICEAIVHRVPVVTNAIGNEGINLINEVDGFVTEDVSQMANYLVDAMGGKHDLNNMTSNALEKLLKIVGPDVAEDHMNGSIYPEVSICVVTWNRLELLEKCVDSVLRLTKYPKFKLLVHSNGCEDGTREYLTKMAEKDARVIPILSDTNDVFVIPNNRMMDMFPTNDCILLNNDTVVTDNWLMALHQTAYSGPDIGMSGSKLLYPDGVLQEFGSELYADGTGRNIGKWEDANSPEYCTPREVGYVSGCSLYVKRSTMDKIGYFDEDFHPCYCEDSDMCYTAKEHGLKTIVTPDSIVYHFEGGTSGTDTSSGFKSYQKVNMIKFLDKHRGKPNGIIWD